MEQDPFLSDLQSLSTLPRHVAIIMDGNGRWAKQRGKMRIYGHSNANHAVRSAVEVSLKAGIKFLTLFAFSSENWRRPKDEIDYLLSLFSKFLVSELSELNRQGVCVRFIGDISRFSPDLQVKIQQAEDTTASNERLVLNIAANYGGRWDIVNACKKICADSQLRSEDLTEEVFASYLSTGNLDVDLMIRTGGEMRISNFLIWQLAYAELYITSTYWPDFSSSTYLDALKWFASRERRFGYTGDQIKRVGSSEDGSKK